MNHTNIDTSNSATFIMVIGRVMLLNNLSLDDVTWNVTDTNKQKIVDDLMTEGFDGDYARGLVFTEHLQEFIFMQIRDGKDVDTHHVYDRTNPYSLANHGFKDCADMGGYYIGLTLSGKYHFLLSSVIDEDHFGYPNAKVPKFSITVSYTTEHDDRHDVKVFTANTFEEYLSEVLKFILAAD